MEFRDPDGVAGVASPTLSQRNLFGPGADTILATQDGAGTIRWMLADHQGSVRDIVENGGAIVNHVTYDSYGNVVAQTNPSQSSRYLYTGREYDQEIDLYYYRSRFYDAQDGRFIGEDPIGFFGRDLNLYRYVEGDPVRFRDPSGLEPNINLLNSSQAPAASAIPSSSVIPIIDVSVGDFTVVGHGNDAGTAIVITETDQSGKTVSRELNADQVADLIKNNGKYRPGQKVKLFVCNSGKQLAKDVAKKLDAKVEAPTGETKILQGYDRPVPVPGTKWVTFSP